jgi:hypothetical protein
MTSMGAFTLNSQPGVRTRPWILCAGSVHNQPGSRLQPEDTDIVFSADPVEDVFHSVMAGGVFIGTSQPTEHTKLEASVPVPGPALARVEK